MYKVEIVNSKEDLKEVFNFLSETFYKDAKKHKEHYFTMSERFEEMNKQFDTDKSFLMYIKDGKRIIAGITGKNSNPKDEKITLGVLAVDEEYRLKWLASKLVKVFEKTCKEKGIKHIDLGTRFRAVQLYLKLKYNYSLMIQVFDFKTIDDVRKENKYNFEEGFSFQGDTYGFIFYKVDDVKEEYLKHFEKNVPTAHAQYIFEKDLD